MYDVRKTCDRAPDKDGQLCYKEMGWMETYLNKPEVKKGTTGLQTDSTNVQSLVLLNPSPSLAAIWTSTRHCVFIPHLPNATANAQLASRRRNALFRGSPHTIDRFWYPSPHLFRRGRYA